MKRTLMVVMLTLLISLSDGFDIMAAAQAQNSDSNIVYDLALYSDLRYRNIGPSRGGRATAVAGIASQPSTFYMGTSGGGVWKTTDYGQSWNNVSDGYFETGSIGAIQVHDADANIIYVGTGSDGIRSNVITGRGVYKSTDAGRTWDFIGLRNAGQIGAVEIHPDNPDLVYVAVIGQAFGPSMERGVYRTKDGGRNWEQILFVSDIVGAVDLELSPDNPNEIYAAMWRGERKPWTIISGSRDSGIFKSNDGGDTWAQMTNGLPGGLFGKADFAVSPSDPDRVYVLIEAPEGEGGLYRSDDRGNSFRLVTTQASLIDRPFYYLNLNADPSNADVLYVNSTGFFKSEDGGRSWQRRSTPHGDNHDIWINPDDPDVYVQSNDGGANVTRDGGRTWSTQRNQLTAELYQVAVDDQFPYWVYAGQQDNSTIRVPSLLPYSLAGGQTAYWQTVGGCETGPAIPKPGNPNIVYANCKGRFGRFNFATGQEQQYYVGASNMYGHNPKDLKFRFQRVSPIHISPHDPDVIYHASQYLHRTTDEGVTWEIISPDLTAFTPETQVISGSPITRDITGEEFYSTIYTVRESPLEKGLIWVGANDGPVHVTRDDGKNWDNVTPADMPPGGRIQNIEPSPHRANKAYFAGYRYLLGDWKPYIYRTNDYGKTWTKLTTGTNGIPNDSPTRVIREDPDREGLLYAGTEFGLYVSFNDGENWQSLQQNLPATPVTDIKVHKKDLVISTMGRSFWIMDDLTPLHQINDSVAGSRFNLFAPRAAYRMRGRGGGRPSAGNPEYPSAAVNIDYYLAETQSNEITMEILDNNGNLVRAFSSESEGERWVVPEEISMREFSLERAGTPRLPNRAGMNRFRWNMTHAGAWSQGRAGSGGPMIVPGTYQVKLSVGTWSHTERFEVLVDPRVAEDGITQNDLVAQLSLSLQVRDLMSNARQVISQIQAALNTGDEGTREKLSALRSKFITASGRYQTPMLENQISYLNSMLNRADQKPGRDAYVRYDELNGLLSDYLIELKQILNN